MGSKRGMGRAIGDERRKAREARDGRRASVCEQWEAGD